ncbi:MAG TPA: ABC transporter permease [Candidatus Paceibacterota bacterium]|nr:ABC transporter permease [Verrucomicrobiota bacterium]HRY50497.1 ABC transporter permease [Candidatus Paceibacterota bacterium]HSA00779.1 ABC transporter permease [Candidatus Paceibacterota bacterium]
MDTVTSNESATQGLPPQRRVGLGRWLSRYGLPLALVLICGVLAWVSPHFLTWQNAIIILRQISINGLLAVGVTLVLLTGGVDLSLGSLVALCGVAAASFAHPGEYPVPVPVLVGICVGLGCGILNGCVVTVGRVAPFIATLGMMTAARGLALIASGGRPVSNLSDSFLWIARAELLGVPIPALLLSVVSVLTWVFLVRTRWGRHLYAVGGNEKAAHASGIAVTRIKILAYALCGALAGLAGVVLASRATVGQPNAGVAYELDAIAAVVIGGTSLSGGVGGIGGTLLGALLMGIINNGLDLMNVNAYYQQVVKGFIIVGAVWLDRRQRN